MGQDGSDPSLLKRLCPTRHTLKETWRTYFTQNSKPDILTHPTATTTPLSQIAIVLGRLCWLLNKSSFLWKTHSISRWQTVLYIFHQTNIKFFWNHMIIVMRSQWIYCTSNFWFTGHVDIIIVHTNRPYEPDLAVSTCTWWRCCHVQHTCVPYDHPTLHECVDDTASVLQCVQCSVMMLICPVDPRVEKHQALTEHTHTQTDNCQSEQSVRQVCACESL